MHFYIFACDVVPICFAKGFEKGLDGLHDETQGKLDAVQIWRKIPTG